MNESFEPTVPLSSARGESKPCPELPYGFRWHMCAWCYTDMSAEVCPIEKDGEISHDCCKPCLAEQLSTLVVLLVPSALLAFLFKAVELV